MKSYIVAIFTMFCGCGEGLECVKTLDCASMEICFAGRCELNPHVESSTINEIPSNCGRSPIQGDLSINEILFKVPEGIEGDANGDGYRNSHEDEFVEIVNRSADNLSLVGLRIENGSKAKFAFTSTCLKSGSSIVVFGGGESTLPNALISNRSFAFSNAGGRVRLTLDGEVIDQVVFSPLGPASVVRKPEIMGDVFVQHRPTLFSPGFCANGRSIESRCGKI